ncbi:MAG: PAS/PAC sensor signal transduction histidine kinase [Promethearchaeota archaeon CR_4]|nr:MAG: PAS/PAC sensor signal transduction histidine kinase [Candidatus Lokiarchaeota archaeon CR_4]
MNEIEFSLYFTVASLGILTLVLFFLYNQYKEKSMLFWAYNGLLNVVGIAILLVTIEDFSLGIINPGFFLSYLPATLLILKGTSLYIGKKMRNTWIFIMIICATWTVLGLSLQFDDLIVYLPASIYLALIDIYTGINFVRYRETKGVGPTITGICFLCYAVFMFGYPFLSDAVSFIPQALLLLAIVTITLVIGFLLVYFERFVTKLEKNEESLLKAKKTAEMANQAKSEFLIHMSDALFLVDPDGKIGAVNPAANILFEFNEIELLGKQIDILFNQASFKDNNSPEKWKEIILKPEKIQDLEISVYSKGGKKIPVSLSKTKMLDPDENLQAFVYIFCDLTDKNRAEENLQLLQKLTETDHLKSNIITWAAHELKTPLTPILGMAELLYKSKKDEKSAQIKFELEDFEILLRNTERLLKIVENFLDVGRLQDGNFQLRYESCDLGVIIQNAIKAVDYQASRKNIKVIPEIFPLKSNFDQERIEQVFINLLSNAIKYSPENTKVYVKLDQIKENEKKVALITVIDQGFGFTSVELEKAFLPFAKVHTQQDQKKFIAGPGLGLYISKNIVESHGGTIHIYSDGANRGTTVKILLPFA